MGVEPITPILQGSVAASGMEAREEGVARCEARGEGMQSGLPFSRLFPVTEVGVEPTGTRLSTSPLNQFAYPVINQKRKP
jgi:hypothetical protein